MKIENFTELQAMRTEVSNLTKIWDTLDNITSIDDEDEHSWDNIDKHLDLMIENRMRLIRKAEKELSK